MKTFKKIFTRKEDTAALPEPTIYPRNAHRVSRGDLSANALKVLYRLCDLKFEAYLVGGAVRDLMVGRHPKDFDVATNAKPEQIRRGFRNCRLIGRRFRLAHIHFGREIIEVATFRAGNESHFVSGKQKRRRRKEPVYGSLKDDVWRRDFTINALYYSVDDFSIIDYVGGMQDIEKKTIRMIGDPEERYRQDPVRILRAVRHAAVLGFNIDPETEAPIAALKHLLGDVSTARIYQEIQKLFYHGKAFESLTVLRRYDLLSELFPATDAYLESDDNDGSFEMIMEQGCRSTDQRIAEDKPINPSFMIAVLLWGPFKKEYEALIKKRMPLVQAVIQAAELILDSQLDKLAIPRRNLDVVVDIWRMQFDLENRRGKKALYWLRHPRFRAAYDFMVIRSKADESVCALVMWWTQFQEENDAERERMIEALPASEKEKRGRK